MELPKSRRPTPLNPCLHGGKHQSPKLKLRQSELRTPCDDTEGTLRAVLDRHRQVVVKRFAWYIERRADDWTSTKLTPPKVAATWAKLTGYSLELATA